MIEKAGPSRGIWYTGGTADNPVGNYIKLDTDRDGIVIATGQPAGGSINITNLGEINLHGTGLRYNDSILVRELVSSTFYLSVVKNSDSRSKIVLRRTSSIPLSTTFHITGEVSYRYKATASGTNMDRSKSVDLYVGAGTGDQEYIIVDIVHLSGALPLIRNSTLQIVPITHRSGTIDTK